MNLFKKEESIPLDVVNLEKACGNFTSLFAKNLPLKIRALAFCSPASFRDPESDDIWHPFLFNNRLQKFIISQFRPFASSLASAAKRFILGNFGKFDVINNMSKQKILSIGPDVICQIKSGSVETSYLVEDDVKQVDWLVLSDGKNKIILTRFDIIKGFFILLIGWIKSTLKRTNSQQFNIASILVLRWILSLSWAVQWTWLESIRIVAKDLKPRKIHCVHELHPMARLVWSVCNENKIYSESIQHANITRTKLWYFSTKDERLSGLCFPNSLVLYSKSTIKLLEPYFPVQTRMSVACGPRYSIWKEKSSNVMKNNKSDGILFVPSLSWWDNKVIIQAIEKLITDNLEKNITIRLHPAAYIKHSDKIKIDQWIFEGKIIHSRKSLQEDFMSSSTVVGATSTLIAEATFVGLKTISLKNTDFLFSPLVADRIIDIKDIRNEVLSIKIQDASEQNKLYYFDILGLNFPVYRLIN